MEREGKHMQPEKFEKRLFGTNGVRGIVGKDMTPELVVAIWRSIRNHAGRVYCSGKRYKDLG